LVKLQIKPVSLVIQNVYCVQIQQLFAVLVQPDIFFTQMHAQPLVQQITFFLRLLIELANHVIQFAKPAQEAETMNV